MLALRAPGNLALRLAAAAVLAGLMAGSAARAQTAECDRLQATIESMPRGGGGGGARFQQAAARQRSEIGRTVAYAATIGCEKSGFQIFGGAQPPQCGPLQTQIQRMRANLAQLENSAAAAGGGDSQRRALMARFNASCGRVEPPPQIAQRPRERSFFENLFGANEPRQQQAYIPPQSDLTQIPLEPPKTRGQDGDGNSYSGAHSGNMAVCVRSCDGGFFPVSYTANSKNPDDLAQLCNALCPNAAVSVYSYSGASDIETAVSLEGEPYRSMPNAFRYRTTFDPSCSCKAPNQTWVAALADAERMISSGGKDIVVTEQKAAELSRPSYSPLKVKTAAPAGKGPPGPAAENVKSDPAATGVIADDGAAAKEASSGAAVATASQETTGISAGDGVAAATVTRDQGATADIVVNGVRKRVRIIAPKL